MTGCGQMCLGVSFLNMQMLKNLSAEKPMGWSVEKSTLTTGTHRGERDGASDWLWTQLSASAFLKEFWCLVHRLQLSWSTHHKAMHYECVCLLTRGTGEVQR